MSPKEFDDRENIRNFINLSDLLQKVCSTRVFVKGNIKDFKVSRESLISLLEVRGCHYVNKCDIN